MINIRKRPALSDLIPILAAVVIFASAAAIVDVFPLLAAIIFAAGAVLMVSARRRRATHGDPVTPVASGVTSSAMSRLEERLSVLERIATDPAERTAREIEALR